MLLQPGLLDDRDREKALEHLMKVLDGTLDMPFKRHKIGVT